MSIIQKLVKVINSGDENGAREVMHDDFKFLMHASGKTLSKDDVVKWVGMKDVQLDKERILFENNEVGFMHAIASFKDGNKEAVMSYSEYLAEIDNGKILNRPAPQIAIDYWNLGLDASLRDVVIAVRAEEAGHRDKNHEFADQI